jgi:hypothetical protein
MPDNIAAAIEVAAASMAGDAPPTASDAPAPSSEPAPTPSSQPVETPSEAAPAPTPTVDRATIEKLRERQAAKSPPRQQAPADPDFAEYQAWRTARAASQSPGIDPRTLQSNPIATLEAAGIDPTALLNTLSKYAVTPDVAAVESRIEARIRAADERAERAEAAIEKIRSERQANAQQRGYSQARQDFIANTTDAAKFPSLAKLNNERRADLGAAKARELMSQGIEDFSLSEVADLVEEDLRILASELLGQSQVAAPSSAQPSTSQQATNGSANRRAATITSDAAASTSSTPRRLSERERLAAAMEVARRG